MDVLESLLGRGLGADINVRNEGHRTPLSLAAAKGNVHVVRLLIERGAEVDCKTVTRTWRGQTCVE
jgi:ankyrin repeat protein